MPKAEIDEVPNLDRYEGSEKKIKKEKEKEKRRGEGGAKNRFFPLFFCQIFFNTFLYTLSKLRIKASLWTV